MRRLKLALVVVLAACGDGSTEPLIANVTGTWSGPLLTSSTMTLVLSQAENGSVTGNGNFSVPTAGGVALTVGSGTHVFPNLSLIIESTGYEDMSLIGKVSANQIRAALNGSGFSGDSILLTRQ